jgi:hypothetical protein
MMLQVILFGYTWASGVGLSFDHTLIIDTWSAKENWNTTFLWKKNCKVDVILLYLIFLLHITLGASIPLNLRKKVFSIV